MNSKDYTLIAEALRAQYSLAEVLGNTDGMKAVFAIKVKLGMAYRKQNPKGFSYKKWTETCGF